MQTRAAAPLILILLQATATAIASESCSGDDDSHDLSAMLQLNSRPQAPGDLARQELELEQLQSFLELESGVSRATSHDAYAKYGLLPAVGHADSVRGSLSFLQTMSEQGTRLDVTTPLTLVRSPRLWAPSDAFELNYENYEKAQNNGTLPDRDPHLSARDMGFETGEPLVSCNSRLLANLSAADAQRVEFQADANLQKALDIFCKAGLTTQTEFYVDPKFRGNHANLANPEGWVDEAFITYVKIGPGKGMVYANQIDLLVQSVHHFSTRPIIVASFGDVVPEEWTPERFPRMILMHAKKLGVGQKFNFNKLRSMIFTKVRTGIVVDSDQFVSGGVDEMFHRTFEEVTAQYPYPIMPVHWMSRDPESDDYNCYSWKWPDHLGKGGIGAAGHAPNRTMRWGHAHPTFTHHSFSFLAKWSAYQLAPKATNPPIWLQQGIEDEDTLNVALWAENATKQWCKFDQINPNDYQTFLAQDKSDLGNRFADKKWFPSGIPMVFFTAHDMKNVTVGSKWLERIWDRGSKPRKVILYNQTWFKTPAELYRYDPNLKCMI